MDLKQVKADRIQDKPLIVKLPLQILVLHPGLITVVSTEYQTLWEKVDNKLLVG